MSVVGRTDPTLDTLQRPSPRDTGDDSHQELPASRRRRRRPTSRACSGFANAGSSSSSLEAAALRHLNHLQVTQIGYCEIPGTRSAWSQSTRPGPRNFRSSSASRKPSDTATTVLSRWSACPRSSRKARCSAKGASPGQLSPKLVKLRQSEALRPLDQHDRGVRHVDTHLHHRCGDKHIVHPVLEIEHDPVLVRWSHAAVEQSEPESLDGSPGSDSRTRPWRPEPRGAGCPLPAGRL